MLFNNTDYKLNLLTLFNRVAQNYNKLCINLCNFNVFEQGDFRQFYLFCAGLFPQQIPPETEEAVDLKNPKDMSYVFGGSYVPLIGKITEEVRVEVLQMKLVQMCTQNCFV